MARQGRKGWSLARLFRSTVMREKSWFILLVVSFVTVVALIFLVIGGSETQDAIKVSINEKSEISPLQQINSGNSSQSSDKLLRVAVAGVLSPTKTLEYYQELLAHMEQKLDRQVTLILKPTYAEVNDLVRGQGVDVALVCSLAYVLGNQDFGMELLVAPQMYGETVYYSYLIIPEGSSATSLNDLKGATFAFTDPLSNSGYLAPSYQLYLLSEVPASFFGRYVFTYNHDNSIMAVADKLVDGAAVDSLVYDQLVANDLELASKTKIIARWGPYGIPPIVASPVLEHQLKQQLRDFFLDLHNSSQGKMILNNLSIDKFVVVPDDIYDSIREMKTKLGW